MKIAGVLAISGFGFAVAFIGLLEFMTSRIHSLRDFEKRTGMEVLGALPPLAPATRFVATEPLEYPNSKPIQQLDMTLAQLIHHPRANAPQTVVVTAAVNGSDKRSLSEQTARGFARMGHKTVLMLLDFRTDELSESESLGNRGTMEHRKFALAPPLLEVIQFTDAGAEPLRIVANPDLASMISELKDQYEYIVIDAPATNVHPDTLHLAPFADVCLMAGLRNRSSSSKLRQARQQLETAGHTVMGIYIR